MKKIIFIVLLLVFLFLYFLFNKHEREQRINNIIPSQDIRKNSKVTVCGKEYYANPIYIEGIDVTKRIIELIEKEYLVSQDKEVTTCATLVNSYPEGSTLEVGLNKIDSNQYRIVFESEFLVNTKSNLIYNVNAMDGSTGSVLGNFK